MITAVEASGGADPLRRIEAAATVKAQIEQRSDELLDHFVNEARSAGCSWTQIGEALGVTRQAAQQRHGGILSRLLRGFTNAKSKRFDASARAAVVAAQSVARGRHHPTIDTEHLLLGLFADDGNVAMAAFTDLGVDRGTVERLVDERSPLGPHPVDGHLPFSAAATKSLELALREAARLDHDSIGCEHIALALARAGDDGIAGQILTSCGVTHSRLDAAIADQPRDQS